ncbi:MAG: cupin domain-containing protein [Gemmataceae bacterium]
MPTSNDWIAALQLQRHPEGGWFRESYRAAERIPRTGLPARFDGDRSFSTMIYYLLEGQDFSALHHIRQDEGWHFYDGAPLVLHLLDPAGRYSTVRLGRNLDAGERPQAVAPAGWLFAATVADPLGYSLVGCTVAPGFEFADFAMPPRSELVARFPEHVEVIERLTRG